jgi:2-hydroxy-3-keto-5-methylthiopentenyl-1-phosphate phosphatase
LNRALENIDPKYIISPDEHLSHYDGLSTTTKLNMLSKEKGLDRSLHEKVWKMKQEATIQVINETFTYDERIRGVLKQLKEEGYTLYCASNSIWYFILVLLLNPKKENSLSYPTKKGLHRVRPVVIELSP